MHLSSERLSQWVVGDGSPEDREHMQTCADCRAEARELENTLSGYGGFARDWGHGHTTGAPSLSQLLRGTHRPARLVHWAGLVAATAVAILVYVSPRFDEDQKPQLGGDVSAQDALLLQQVNTQLSRTTPMAMEPLLILLEDKDSTKEQIGER